jgi:hypothetical protein
MILKCPYILSVFCILVAGKALTFPVLTVILCKQRIQS